MVVGWHVSSRAIRTGLVRTGTEVVNWDAFRLMRCCRCVVRNNRITNIKLRSYGNSLEDGLLYTEFYSLSVSDLVGSQ
jgi:hypothetical protein